MSLESILKPAKWLDERLQKRYTQLGQKIPDKAYMSAQLGIAGNYVLIFSGIKSLAPAFLSTYFLSTCLALPFFADGANMWAFANGLGSKGSISSDAIAENPAYAHPLARFARGYTRTARLPMMLASGAAFGKVGYDIAMLATAGQPLDIHTAGAFKLALGLFLDASIMYLTDQDTSLLQKQGRNYLLELLGKIKAGYEKSKEALRPPVPNPQPQPANAYSAMANSA